LTNDNAPLPEIKSIEKPEKSNDLEDLLTF
jgi:hypothetical protein